jgi:hypothetical protein
LTWKRTTSPRRSLCLAGILILVLGSGGCGHFASPSDPAEGRKALLAALDAWKGGEQPDALAQRTPPIHATDGDWMSGLRLLSYKADDDGKLVGSDVNYKVVLELKTTRGKLVKQDAVYVVTTHPHVLVLRKDSL